MTDKERYATIGTWVEVFRKEGVNVGWSTINCRLRESGIIGETARDKVGRVLHEGFYSETDVRKFCSDLLDSLPQADKDGLVQQDGETYGTIGSLSRLLGISAPAIQSRIRKTPPQAIRGKSQIGRVQDFFPLSDVRKLCSDLLELLPEAGEDGLIQKDGETYGTIRSLSRLLGISVPAIQSRILQNPPRSIRGKDQGGQIQDFYPLSEIQKLCSDLLESLPQASEDGLIQQDGETYGTIRSLSRLLGISARAIQSRIRKNPPQAIRGKSQIGRVQDFFPLSDIRKLCSDLLELLPEAGEDGLIQKDGETYGTIQSLSRLLGISVPAIQSRILQNPPRSIRGKDQGGQIQDFYPLSEIQKLCSDLLESLPQASEDGLIQQDGETYGTIHSLSRLLGISYRPIQSRIRQKPPRSIRGKDQGGGNL